MKKILIVMLMAFCSLMLYAGQEKTAEEIAAKKAENEKRAKAFILLGEKAITEQKVVEAFDYYLLAAKHGNADAQAVVGNCFLNGSWGCKKDLDKAKKWFRKAARQGNNVAQAQLSRMFGSGTGVQKKPRKSAKLNRKSQF